MVKIDSKARTIYIIKCIYQQFDKAQICYKRKSNLAAKEIDELFRHIAWLKRISKKEAFTIRWDVINRENS